MDGLSQNSLQIIKKRYVSLSEVEKKIANYILENPQKVINMTTRLLAAKTSVSEGSIIKFSNKLGFIGFSKLKINIAQNLTDNNNFIFDTITEEDNPKIALSKMIENTISALRSTYEIISLDDFKKFADLLINVKKRIEIYGVGSSSMIANDAYYRLLRIGLPVNAVVDAHICSISASMLDDQCVALGISHTGRTIETLRAMEIAKSKKAKTICITSYTDSPLAQLCDISIIIASKESELNKEAVVSRLTQLVVIDSICSYISCQRKDISIELMESNIDIIEEHRK